MKLSPVTKFDKTSTATSKECDDDTILVSYDNTVILFMANLEQSGSRIPAAWSVIFTFSLVTLYLTKTENRNSIT